MIRNLKSKLDALRAGQQTPPPKPKEGETPSVQREAICRFERFCYPLTCTTGNCSLKLGQNPDPQLLACLTQTALPADFDGRRLLYLDTETTGLSTGAGTLAFLVGIGYYDELSSQYIVEQYLMEDYDQEPDLLSRLLATLDRFDTLVTYNGKSFDVPLLEVRYVMNRLHSRLRQMTQLDLLHAARRIYKRRIGSCSLGNMERTLLGIERADDIPGAEIPECFFAYVKDRDPKRMNLVLKHNRQDILSMPLLMGTMLQTLQLRASDYPEDDYSCGRLFLRSRQWDWAEACLLRASGSLPEARLELAAYYKRQGRWPEAETIWLAMVEASEGGTLPYHELAKYYEHILHQPARAYRLIVRLRDTLGQWGVRDEEIEKRYRRLKKYAQGDA